MGEPREDAQRAEQIVEGEIDLLLTDVVIAEIAYVVATFYNYPREIIVDRLTAFIQRPNMSLFCLDKELAVEALLLCRPSGRVSFADAMLWAIARSSDRGVVYSFDRRFPSSGIELKQSP
jgi:predicted nucleic acid-binding protein